MKAQTKKIVLTKQGKVNKIVSNMLANCVFYNNRIYTGYYNGSGRFTTAHSAKSTVLKILEAQGYKYITGNDAPRGGISGEYVQVSKIASDFLHGLTKTNF
jgi:hypothetical protein